MPDLSGLVVQILVTDSVLAYIGPGPGMELIPYFLALLAWMGTALAAVVLWPVAAFLRRFRRGKSVSGDESSVSREHETDSPATDNK